MRETFAIRKQRLLRLICKIDQHEVARAPVVVPDNVRHDERGPLPIRRNRRRMQVGQPLIVVFADRAGWCGAYEQTGGA